MIYLGMLCAPARCQISKLHKALVHSWTPTKRPRFPCGLSKLSIELCTWRTIDLRNESPRRDQSAEAAVLTWSILNPWLLRSYLTVFSLPGLALSSRDLVPMSLIIIN